MIEMDFKKIKEAKKDKEKTALRGWVYRQRASNKVAFIVLRDNSGIIQCVAKKGDSFFEKASKVSIESSIKVEGKVKEDERAPGGYELRLTGFEVVGEAERFPITQDQSKEFLRDKKHLWLRSRKSTAMLKIRSTIFGAIDEFFRKKGYYEFQSPMFVSTAAEGGSTLFEVDYYDKPIYLTQTWQLYAEAAIYSLEKLYTIAPSFRAEKSRTSRHLTEYWHAEVETAWQEFEGLQEQGEELVSFICKKVLEENEDELDVLEVDKDYLKSIEPPFPRLRYEEALELLEEEGMEVKKGKDLSTPQEKKLTEIHDKPVFITHYPKKIKAFYMKEAPEDSSKVLGYDLLVPHVGELIGGSEREEDQEELKRRLQEEEEDIDEYDWFMDTRKYGSVPHSGFGLGVDRCVQWICGLESIQEAIGFARTPDRVKP